MSDKYKRKQGDRIQFDLFADGKMVGFGIIKGCAGGPFPILGFQWIVEVESPIPYNQETYPFTNIVIFDSLILSSC